MTEQHTTDEQKIRTVVDAWVKAICDGNMNGVIAAHANDIVMFDVPPPLQIEGLEGYKKQWELYFQYVPHGGPGSFELVDLQLFVGGEVAFGHSLLKVAGGTARLTLGFRKIDGAWHIAHEHHSFPSE
jgi:ketosteroid isomerase-like protein